MNADDFWAGYRYVFLPPDDLRMDASSCVPPICLCSQRRLFALRRRVATCLQVDAAVCDRRRVRPAHGGPRHFGSLRASHHCAAGQLLLLLLCVFQSVDVVSACAQPECFLRYTNFIETMAMLFRGAL